MLSNKTKTLSVSAAVSTAFCGMKIYNGCPSNSRNVFTKKTLVGDTWPMALGCEEAKFGACISWPCGCERLADITTCPIAAFEELEDDGPAWCLRRAVLDGQQQGFVNHNEGHAFVLFDVRKNNYALEVVVFAVLEQEFQAWIFR